MVFGLRPDKLKTVLNYLNFLQNVNKLFDICNQYLLCYIKKTLPNP